MQADYDKGLQSYFTDVEYLRQTFKQWLAAPTLPKRLLVIHGIGGVGKSSLLRMFRLYCKSIRVPVALASGDEAKSALDVLYFKSPSGKERGWVPDLKMDGVRFPKFDAAFKHYRAIQAGVIEEAKQAQDTLGRRVASKTAEAAGGAMAGAVLGSVLPGIGTVIGSALGGMLGGMGVEALTDWLFSRGFKKPDVDLLLDPGKKLTEEFLADVTKAAEKRRLVLMLDTFEQMSALEDWASDVARCLPANVLLVIAGHTVPNWGPEWVEELKPMSEEDMRELVRRYYATRRGGEPDPKQVEAIIRFARGLPLAVTSAVQLWVKYGVENFEAVKPEVAADLVDHLMEGVPEELVPVFEAAAVVRWFDQPILRAVMKEKEVRRAYQALCRPASKHVPMADFDFQYAVRMIYDELWRFPFARSRTEGFAFHDAVREIIDENLRIQDAERHRELHERAAVYFERRLEKVTGEEAERLRLERLYHRVLADEKAGIKLFQEMAEELVRYRLVNRLRALLNDVGTYLLEQESSRLWKDYYVARLDLQGSWFQSDTLLESIAQNPNAPDQLVSYALGRLGLRLARPEYISKPGGAEKAIRILGASIEKAPVLDPTTAGFLWELGMVHERLCQWDKAWKYFRRFESFASRLGQTYQAAYLKIRLKDLYAKIGDWRNLLSTHYAVMELLDALPDSSNIGRSILHTWTIAFCWMGRYAEAEQIFEEGLEHWAQAGMDTSYFHRYIGYSLGLQDRFDEAQSEFQKAMEESRHWVSLRDNFDIDRATLLHYSFWAIIDMRAGELGEARRKFLCAIWLKRKHKDYIGLPELFTGLGTLQEVRANYAEASRWYVRCLRLKWTGRRYFECGALAGLVRVKHAQGDYAAIAPLLAEAEQLSQQYEYNDHLASLRLTQGHIAWDGHIPEWDKGFDAALRYYQLALIHALRYNRFLLDEVLSGRPQGTPLRPIIPECLKRGEEGRRMLIALREWWQTCINDIGTPRPDTISPIPEGIPLLEAERIAREREPGDGSPQKTVIEQIEEALKGTGAG